MRKNSRAAFVNLLLIVALASGAAGCAGPVSAWLSSPGTDAFITDRVVKVHIIMDEESWATCQGDALKEQFVRADFWFDGELVPDVAVRPKGNSSLKSVARMESPRLSLKVDFNLFNSARTFRGLKKLNLNNGFMDPTLIRERLAYELFDQMDVPTPRTSHVDLWVNDTHLGVYTQVEQVDKTFLGRHFNSNAGNLYKPEMPAAYLDWTEAELEEQRAKLGIDAGSQDSEQLNIGGGKWLEILQALEQWELADDQIVIPEEPRPDPRQPRDFLDVMELKTNEGSTDHSALFRLLEVINNEPDETFPDEIEKVLDVDAALRYLAVSTLLVHLDNYIGIGHNYYLYEVDGKFTMIPWDLNMAFGGFTCSIGREGLINLYIDEPTCGPLAERPLVQRLLSHEAYLDTYHEYLEAMLDGPFSADAVESRIDELAGLIRPFVQKDELKFFSTADFERALSEDISVPGQPGAPPASPPPLPIPNLSPESLDCLKQYFTRNEFQELLTRKPTQVEFQKLKYCLTLEELTAFLQRRPGQSPPAAQMGPQPGRTHIGLKTFVAERSLSVRQQLAGKRPSHGDGSGNGGKGFGLPGRPGQPGAPPPTPRKNPPGGRP